MSCRDIFINLVSYNEHFMIANSREVLLEKVDHLRVRFSNLNLSRNNDGIKEFLNVIALLFEYFKPFQGSVRV